MNPMKAHKNNLKDSQKSNVPTSLKQVKSIKSRGIQERDLQELPFPNQVMGAYKDSFWGMGTCV